MAFVIQGSFLRNWDTIYEGANPLIYVIKTYEIKNIEVRYVG